MLGALVAVIVVALALMLDLWRRRRERSSDEFDDHGEPLSWRSPVDVTLVMITVLAMVAGALWILGVKSY